MGESCSGSQQPNTYLCDDGNAAVEILADTPADAARAYVDGGGRDAVEETCWIHVHVQRVDHRGRKIGANKRYRVALDPAEPECVEGEKHDWQYPHSIVGGSDDNPGVWLKGGGVVATAVCLNCGIERATDSWAQDWKTGEQGLDSTRYTAGKYATEVESLREGDE